MSLHRALAPAHSALLPAVPPFSLAASLAAMSGFRPSAGDQLIMSDRLRKGLAHPDEPGEAVAGKDFGQLPAATVPLGILAALVFALWPSVKPRTRLTILVAGALVFFVFAQLTG